MRSLSLSLTALLSACTYYVPLSNPQTHNQVIQQPLAAEKPCPPLERTVEIHTCPEKAEESPEKKDSISREYKALLDTIAWAEGTGCYYNMMLGRTLFLDYSAHPVETGEMPEKGIPFGPRWRRNTSTAAGRYQFLYRTYKSLQSEGFFQTGFTPEEQDKAALYLIKDQLGVTDEIVHRAIETKDFTELWNILSWGWASLPCDESKKMRREQKKCFKGRGRYNQFVYQDKDLQNVFLNSYGTPKK